MKKRIVKWTLKEEKLRAVETIAIVDEPAIQTNWRVFSKDEIESSDLTEEQAAEMLIYMAAEEELQAQRTFEVPEERFKHLTGQNLIFAPIMIANKMIARKDDDGSLFYGYFPGEEIRKAAYYFTENKLIDSFNINHDQNRKVNSISLVESWVVENSESDKAYYFGYNLEPGSWVGLLRINDDKLYQDYVSSGLLNGVSVEAYLVETVLFKNLCETGDNE